MKGVSRILVSMIVLGAVAAAVPGRAHAAESTDPVGELAVIVNRLNTSPDPTFEDLRAILSLDRQFWKNGKRVVLILPSSGSASKNFLLDRIYHRTDEQLRKDWARRLFAGEIPAVPTSLRSVEALVAAVAHSPGAVSVVPASTAVPESVRVLAIDGKHPGQPGYPLTKGGF